MTKNDEYKKLCEKLSELKPETAFFYIKGIASNEDLKPDIKINHEYLNVLIPAIAYIKGCYYFLESDKTKIGHITEEQHDKIHGSVKKWFDEYISELTTSILIDISQAPTPKEYISFEGVFLAASVYTNVILKV